MRAPNLIAKGAAEGISENTRIEMIEPYFDVKTPQSVASMTGGTVVVMMPSVGGKPEITDYFKLFDYDIGILTQAFQQTQ